MKDEGQFTISSGTIIRAILIGAGFWALWFLRDVVLVILTAIVLASALEPAILFFVRRRFPRLLALILVYGGALLCVLTLLYFFVPAFVDDVNVLLSALPRGVDLSTLLFGHGAGEGAAVLFERGTSLFDFFTKSLASQGAVQSLSQIFGGFISFVLTIVLSFYLSAQEHGIESFLRVISPARKAGYVVGLWYRAQTKIGLWFQGQILLGALVGVLAFLGLMILGVKSAFFLAVTIMVLEIVPVFGPVLAAVPAIAIAYTDGITLVPQGGLTAAAIVVALYVVIQQFESHLIYPLVVRKVIGISPVLVIISLVVGAKLAGFIGLVLAVPLMAVLMEYLGDVAREKRVEEHIRARVEGGAEDGNRE